MGIETPDCFMKEYLLEKLDYIKIKKLLEKEVFTYSGKELLKYLQPSCNIETIEQWQKETSEMKSLLEGVKGGFPFVPLEKDIEGDIKQSYIQDNILNTKSLIYIARVLETIHRFKDFLEKIPEKDFPIIKGKTSDLKYFRILEKTIKECINEDGEIVDDASPQLKKIRQKIGGFEKKIRDRLENIIKDPRYRSIIQDDIITIRLGRYVVPVKHQEKNKFPGVIHDKSESGQTVFMEPISVIELNNELKELLLEEKREEYRILQRLTASVGQNGEEILSNFKHLGEMDLINAKAEISVKMNANQPNINNKGIIKLIQARHPLLKGKAVPIDIELGDNFNVLIITGPNTGGKTVTLKTVGLLNLMAQSGLHIPAAVDSEISVFKEVFADIGDEQSIEQNLSTFSSHIKNIISILKSADQHSLILIDELGAGTDPSEGSALAMAILDFLKKKGARVLSTTHHDSLKAYAYLTQGVRNARVEFDEKTLQPTYKIVIGLPGNSCAFSIASRLGLSETILKSAESYLEKEKIDLEKLINRMEKDRIQIGNRLKNITREELEVKKLRLELQEKIDNLENEKVNIKLQAYQEAEKIINNTQARTKEIINSLKKKKDVSKKYTEEIGELEELKREVKKQATQSKISETRTDIIDEGDSVIIKSLNKEGIVRAKNEKKHNYMVQIGNIKFEVPESDIRKINKIETKEKKGIGELKPIITFQQDNIDKKAGFKNEINIRHMNAADAIVRLEKYLDDALLLNISPVYIIHGKGKGILRKTVAQLLESLTYVKEYRYGEIYEGGDGVTVVYF